MRTPDTIEDRPTELREGGYRDAVFVPEPRVPIPPWVWVLLVLASLCLGVSVANFAALLFLVAAG